MIIQYRPQGPVQFLFDFVKGGPPTSLILNRGTILKQKSKPGKIIHSQHSTSGFKMQSNLHVPCHSGRENITVYKGER